MDDAQLQLVYRAVVVAKLTYASSSWWGFATASDWQRLEGFLRRGYRQNLYSSDKPCITDILEEADENLFNSIRYNPSYILHQLLPRRTESSNSLRSRSHNFDSLISTTTEILSTTCCFSIHTTSNELWVILDIFTSCISLFFLLATSYAFFNKVLGLRCRCSCHGSRWKHGITRRCSIRTWTTDQHFATAWSRYSQVRSPPFENTLSELFDLCLRTVACSLW